MKMDCKEKLYKVPMDAITVLMWGLVALSVILGILAILGQRCSWGWVKGCTFERQKPAETPLVEVVQEIETDSSVDDDTFGSFPSVVLGEEVRREVVHSTLVDVMAVVNM